MINYYPLEATFTALADPTRRAILQNLSQKGVPAGGLVVMTLAEPFDISLPATSRHLKVLEKAGLILRQREGRIHRCGLDPAPLREVDQVLKPLFTGLYALPKGPSLAESPAGPSPNQWSRSHQ